MPLQLPEIPDVPDAERARHDALCAQTRRECGRKDALARALFVCVIVLPALGFVWSVLHTLALKEILEDARPQQPEFP